MGKRTHRRPAHECAQVEFAPDDLATVQEPDAAQLAHILDGVPVVVVRVGRGGSVVVRPRDEAVGDAPPLPQTISVRPMQLKLIRSN